MGVPSAPGGGGGGALGGNPVQASPEQLRKEAEHWDETAQGFESSVEKPLSSVGGSSSGFGMMAAAYQPYSDVLTRMRTWAKSGGQEFSKISDALNAAASGYRDTEDTNVSATTQIAQG